MSLHDHDHYDRKEPLTFEERMIKLLQHWTKHNTDHAETYREWGKRAGEQNLAEIESILNEVAEMTVAINAKFLAAAEKVKKGDQE